MQNHSCRESPGDLKEWSSWQGQALSLGKRSHVSDLLLLFICIISETSKMRCFVENDLNQQRSGMYCNPFGAFIHKEVLWQMETVHSSVPWLSKFVYCVRSWCLSRVSGLYLVCSFTNHQLQNQVDFHHEAEDAYLCLTDWLGFKFCSFLRRESCFV